MTRQRVVGVAGAPGGAWAPFVSACSLRFWAVRSRRPIRVRFVFGAGHPGAGRWCYRRCDLRVTALELPGCAHRRLAGSSRFDPPASSVTGSPMLPALDLGSFAGVRIARSAAFGPGRGGQQLLGMALTRDVSWKFGESKDITLELRRPLFFFSGSPKLVAPVPPTDPIFAPSRRIL